MQFSELSDEQAFARVSIGRFSEWRAEFFDILHGELFGAASRAAADAVEHIVNVEQTEQLQLFHRNITMSM